MVEEGNTVMPHSDKQWETFGQSDPYYGVITLDRFRKNNLTASSLIDFFRSGEDHIHYMLDQIRLHVAPDFHPLRALDFGCGVGRCTIPLARLCPSVTGVDVSNSMLREAERNSANQSITNITFALSDDNLSRVSGTFDLVHSFIVFQHFQESRGLRILQELINRMDPNGVGIVQFLYARDIPAFVQWIGAFRKHVPFFNAFVNLFYGKPLSAPLMEKNAYSLNRILRLFQINECGNIHILLEGVPVFRSAVILFQKRKDEVPYEKFYGNG
jgi:SAM-dependent methyltransferase